MPCNCTIASGKDNSIATTPKSGLKLLLCNASTGEYLTTAQWMREFVRSHPDYKFDSVVNDRIVYDLLMAADKIESGEMDCPELFVKPRFQTDRHFNSPQR